MLKKIPFVLAAIILAVILIDHLIPIEVKQAVYSISLVIKSVIIFLLPIIVFSLLFKTSVNLSTQATRLILMVIALVCTSNFIATFLSHYIGVIVFNFDLEIIEPKLVGTLQPLWNFEIPKLIANDKAMISGIILGIITCRFNSEIASNLALKLDKLASNILKVFAYLIPIFITGFIIKMQHDGTINIIIKDYAKILAIVVICIFSYIGLAYFILCNFNVKQLILNIKNMLPAMVLGFSTMSSAATMPVTIIATEKNTVNKDIAKSVIPITVNIHLLGDCISMPIFAYAILKNFGAAEPTLISFVTFTMFFVIAKFSVAAVPGGGVLVMIPVLEKYLGFTTEMSTLMTALYVLFDPIITSANVLGNGAFAKLVDNVVSMKMRK